MPTTLKELVLSRQVLGMVQGGGRGTTITGNAGDNASGSSGRKRQSAEVGAVPPAVAPTAAFSAVPSPSTSSASAPSAPFVGTAASNTAASTNTASSSSTSKTARRTSLLSAEARLRTTSMRMAKKVGGRSGGTGGGIVDDNSMGLGSMGSMGVGWPPCGSSSACMAAAFGGDGAGAMCAGGGGLGEPFSFWSSGHDCDDGLVCEYDDGEKVAEDEYISTRSMGHGDWDGDGTAGSGSSGGVKSAGGGCGDEREDSWRSVQNVAPSIAAARTSSDNAHCGIHDALQANTGGGRAKNMVLAAAGRSAGAGTATKGNAAVPTQPSLISPVPIHAGAPTAAATNVHVFHANAPSNVVSLSAAAAATRTSTKILKAASGINRGKAKADLTCRHPVTTMSVDKTSATVTNTHAANTNTNTNTKSGGSGSSSRPRGSDRSMDRMVALIDVLERSGKLIPMDENEDGADASVGIPSLTDTATDITTPKAGTAIGATITTNTPSGGQGLAACVSATSSFSNNPSGGAYGQSTLTRGGTATFASPLPLESYRHLLLDRFLPPRDVATPNVATAGTATGAWPADTETTDPSSTGDSETAKDIGSGDGGTQKRARGGRGKRTKKVAKKKSGRGRAGGTDIGCAVTTTTATSRGRGKSGKGPARNDGRPPSLDAYLAGLGEAKLKKAEIRRRALEREEEYGLASVAASTIGGVARKGKAMEVDEEMKGEDVFSFDDHDAAQKGRGGGGYPKTLATDNDGDNLAPKHCFGRKWLYELVCEPTGALADASSKENVGPAKKKRRRVFTAAPKNGSSVVGGGAASKVTTTTIGKDATNHRICVRCRHCKDSKDCLRPSSLSDTHFYNLLVFWANNHYERCEAVPAAIQAKYDEAKAIKARGRKAYWMSEAHAIGLRNIVDKDGKIGGGVAFAPTARGSE